MEYDLDIISCILAAGVGLAFGLGLWVLNKATKCADTKSNCKRRLIYVFIKMIEKYCTSYSI